MDQNILDWFAARLSIALYDTNQEYRMGVHDLREQLKHMPGAQSLTMSYGPGEKQIFTMGADSVEFPAGAMVGSSELESAFVKKKLKN